MLSNVKAWSAAVRRQFIVYALHSDLRSSSCRVDSGKPCEAEAFAGQQAFNIILLQSVNVAERLLTLDNKHRAAVKDNLLIAELTLTAP